ncbi:hypothetical protein BGW38_002327 [Lunasporangiospora selenospora]|uniref:Cyclin-like domain-containing protein n=1 Tax=Lunasporangiospora selenospora TaxID=979761 RepID=A0A9P6FT08_9FUNG|nr:hypothetical protein BGW38_002327 [Lunasporangiospora selenospora]
MDMDPASTSTQILNHGSATGSKNVSMLPSVNTDPAPSSSSASAKPFSSKDNGPLAESASKSLTSSTSPSDSKRTSGTGHITLDDYHQLQQKRQQERQRHQHRQLQEQHPSEHGQPRKQPVSGQTYANGSQSSRGSQPVHMQESSSSSLPSLDKVEQILSMVQSSIPALSSVSTQQPQQVQMPGPDLANLIFGNSLSTAATTTTTSDGSAAKSAANGHISSSNQSQYQPPTTQHHHRKSTGGVTNPGSAGSQANRTTSPPTPVPGSATGTHRGAGSKGQKAIHAIELIRIAGEILQFPPTTIGTSLIYYHKYRAYLHQAYKRGERDNEATKADEYLFATACLHLASKCTEVGRKVRDLVNVTYRVMNPAQPALSLSTKPGDEDSIMTSADSKQSTGSGANPFTPSTASGTASSSTAPIPPPPTAATYWHIRDSLLTTELMLLRILQFDLDVSLPFSDVLRIYKGMGMVFDPTDEEAAQLYPNASNFDAFLPALQQQSNPQHHSSSSSSSPDKYGTPSSSSSSASGPPSTSGAAAHPGIHPTLSALVQISITFCIDALCSSNIALNTSSRVLAMGSIYLAVRSAGLELPLPFEEWCFAWGRPMIAAGFGHHPSSGYGITGSMGSSGSGSGVMGIGGTVPGVNGIMGLNTGTNSLFVSSPRTSAGTATKAVSTSAVGDGASTFASSDHSSTMGPNGSASKDQAQTQSPALSIHPSSSSGNLGAPHINTTMESSQQPMTIVDEVRKIVQELCHFYAH